MKTFSKHILALSLATMACNAMAQGLSSAYFIDDYKFRHTMNPAYDNEQNYVSVPALGNFNMSMQGNFGLGDVLVDNPRYGIDSNKKKTTFMNPYVSTADALSGFNTTMNKITADVDLTLLSAGFRAFGGYNTISLDSRTDVALGLPYSLLEFAKNTGNKSYVMDDINAQAQSYVQLAFGHSRQLGKHWRVGAKVKFLFGVARADVQFTDLRADLSADDKWIMSGKAIANVSMKGFRYLTTHKEYNDASKGTYDRVDDIDVDGVGVGGFGLAVDLGATYKPNKDWTISVAVTDLGYISWTSTMTASNKQSEFVFNGFHDITADDYDANGNRKDNSFEAQTDKYGDQLADFANLSNDGDTGGRSTLLAATVNVGCEYTLPVYRGLKFGLLSTTRLHGKYTWTEGRLSANIAPLKWLNGGVNFAMNNYTTSIGWVLNIHPRAFNVFVGMDHLLGKTSKEYIPLDSNASFNVGFNVTF